MAHYLHNLNLLYLGIYPLVLGNIIFNNAAVNAQITPDNTLGAESSLVTPNATVKGQAADLIEGGAARGENLFHSFQDFNVRELQRVYFANPNGIDNILSRVTGGNISQILGTLGVDGAANLFLINPNGIIFGENSAIDVTGSFTATSADAVLLGENGLFSASDPSASNLVNIAPSALFYNQIRNFSGAIENSGRLTVTNGQSLTLSGDTVVNSGTLEAPGGIVALFGNEVNLINNAVIDVSSDTSGGTVLVGGDYQGTGNDLIAQQTFVGSNVNIKADALQTGDGGKVIVWADDTTHFYGNIFARGGAVSGDGGFVEVSGKNNLAFNGFVDTSAVNGSYGTLLLDPTNIVVIDEDDIIDEDTIFTDDLDDVDEFTDEDIDTENQETRILNAAINEAQSNVTLQATNDITFDAEVEISEEGVGLTAEANNNINVNNNIDTNGGDISLDAGQDININQADSGLDLVISSHPDDIDEAGGNINLTAAGNVSITSVSFNLSNNEFGASDIEEGEGGDGDGGNFSITAGGISPETPAIRLEDTTIDGEAFGEGLTGNITLNALNEGKIELIGNTSTPSLSINTNQSNSEDSSINIVAGEIDLTNYRLIAKSRDGSAVSGDITLTATTGNINIDNSEIIGDSVFDTVNERFSEITINAENGSVTIDNNTRIIVVNSDTGIAGQITIGAAESLDILNGSLVSADGNLGEIGIGTPIAQDSPLVQQPSDISIQDSQITATNAEVQRDEETNIQFNDNGNVQLVTNEGIIDIVPPQIIEDENGESIEIAADAGSIDIQASGDIAISDLNSDANNSIVSTSTFGEGEGGDITITSEQGIITSIPEGQDSNLGQVQILSQSGTGESPDGSTGFGQAGTIVINADNAENGAIQLDNATVSSAARVPDTNSNDITFNSPDIALTNNTEVTSENISSTGGADGEIDDEDVGIVQFKLSPDDPDILKTLNVTNSVISTSTESGVAGDITINASESVSIDGQGTFTRNQGTPEEFEETRGGIFAEATDAGGNAGNTEVFTSTLTVENQAEISSQSENTANAGNIFLQIGNQLTLDSEASINFSSVDGEPGQIFIRNQNETPVPNITIQNGATISANTTGRGGNSEENPDLFFGVIDLITNNLTLDNEGVISASTEGFGRGGEIRITTNNLNITRQSTIRSNTSSEGNGGDIFLEIVDNEEVDNPNKGNLIISGTGNSEQQTGIIADASGTGKGGTIIIAEEISDDLIEGVRTIETEIANDIPINEINDRIDSLEAPPVDRIDIDDGGTISANTNIFNDEGNLTNISETDENGNIRTGGNIFISTVELTQNNNSDVTAGIPENQEETIKNQSNLNSDEIIAKIRSGNIVVRALGTSVAGKNRGEARDLSEKDNPEETISLRDKSDILTIGGTGGLIVTDSRFILAAGNSDLVAGAEGKISVEADLVLGLKEREERTPLNDVNGAVIDIDGFEIDNTIPKLSEEVVDVSSLIDRRCAVSGEESASSFTIIGQGGLPPNLDKFLSIPDILPDFGTFEPEVEDKDKDRNQTITPLPSFTNSNLGTEIAAYTTTWKFPHNCFATSVDE